MNYSYMFFGILILIVIIIILDNEKRWRKEYKSGSSSPFPEVNIQVPIPKVEFPKPEVIELSDREREIIMSLLETRINMNKDTKEYDHDAYIAFRLKYKIINNRILIINNKMIS